MTLREIRAAHPNLFYPQTWMDGEAFMDEPPSGHLTPGFVAHPYRLNPYPRLAVLAVDLAALYVRTPDDPRWRRFLWTDDKDQHGNQVYVAGLGQNGCEGFQIHRHLVPDHRWAWVTP